MIFLNESEKFLLEEIVKKNFAAKYKGSILGILWSILKPLLIMILLTIIFSTAFGFKISNYPVYYLSGKCIFDFFSASTTVSLMAIKNNENILKRTAPPAHIFILGGIISEFINFLITLVILIFVMIVTHAHFYFFTMPLSIIPIIFCMMMIVGLGYLLSILCVYYTDIQHLWGVITMMLMYASAIFYPMDIIPDPYHKYLLLNPLYWIISQFRDLIMYGTFPDALNLINTCLFSIIVLIFGIIIYKKYGKNITMKL